MNDVHRDTICRLGVHYSGRSLHIGICLRNKRSAILIKLKVDLPKRCTKHSLHTSNMSSVQPTHNTPSKPTTKRPLFPLAGNSHDEDPGIVSKRLRWQFSPLLPLDLGHQEVCNSSVGVSVLGNFIESHDGVPSIASEDNNDAILDADVMDPVLLDSLFSNSHDGVPSDFWYELLMGDEVAGNDIGVGEGLVESLEDSINDRVSLINFLTHMMSTLSNLQVCENPSCNQLLTKYLFSRQATL